MDTQIQTKDATVLSTSFSVTEMKGQVQLIQKLMSEIMHEGEHFGVIPGTPKPTLLKPGAEKLCFTFRLDPQYEVTEQFQEIGGIMHYRVLSKCTIYHIPTGNRLASGFGSCTTREKKYAYRNAKRKCPKCGKETIFKSKQGDGWYCWAKQNGCGATFKTGDASIEGQEAGLVPNPDLADQENTILKMANKRSLIAGVLNATAASDIFTQDLEDIAEPKPEAKKEPSKPVTENIPIIEDDPNAAPLDNWKASIYACETVEQVESIRQEAQKELDPAGANFLKPHFEQALKALKTKSSEPLADGDRLELIKASFRDCETVKDLNAVMKALKDEEKRLVADSYQKRLRALSATVAK